MNNSAFREIQEVYLSDKDKGYIFVEEVYTPKLIKVADGKYHCDMWCPQCEASGSFLEKLHEMPKAWNCPVCETSYDLPSTFYNKVYNMFRIEHIPTDVQMRYGLIKTIGKANIVITLMLTLIISMLLYVIRFL